MGLGTVRGAESQSQGPDDKGSWDRVGGHGAKRKAGTLITYKGPEDKQVARWSGGKSDRLRDNEANQQA